MKNLGEIIKKLEEKYRINVLGNYDHSTLVDSVSFLTEAESINLSNSSNTLYLVNDDEILNNIVNTDDEGLNNSFLLLSDKSLPDSKVLNIREEISIFDIFNTISNDLKKGDKLKRAEEKLFSELYKGKGMDELLKTAHEFLNNPITICDTSFCIISLYPQVTDSKNLEVLRGKRYLKKEPFEDMYDRHIIDRLYNSDEVIITRFKGYNYDWLFKNIKINNNVSDYICLRSTVRDYTDEDLEFLKIFSKILSIELQKQTNFSQPAGLWYDYFLIELLKGNTTRTWPIEEYLEYLKKENVCFNILLIQSENSTITIEAFKNYFEQLKAILSRSTIVFLQGNIIVLLPSNNNTDQDSFNKKRFETFLKLNNLIAFISFKYTDINQTHSYYKQVLELSKLQPKNKMNRRGSCIYFEDNILETIFNQIEDQNFLRFSLYPDLLKIIEYDKKYNTNFTNTIKEYLKQNRNSTQTSKILHIHKSTFFYRIKKIEELFGISINDSKKLFELELAFKIQEHFDLNKIG